jgi:hypothetical protein
MRCLYLGNFLPYYLNGILLISVYWHSVDVARKVKPGLGPSLFAAVAGLLASHDKWSRPSLRRGRHYMVVNSCVPPASMPSRLHQLNSGISRRIKIINGVGL